jgi:hypothetical protein
MNDESSEASALPPSDSIIRVVPSFLFFLLGVEHIVWSRLDEVVISNVETDLGVTNVEEPEKNRNLVIAEEAVIRFTCSLCSFNMNICVFRQCARFAWKRLTVI